MTDAERLIWSKLRMKQFKGLLFSRQKPLGEYIADFYCHKARLVIEIDGGQHFTNSAIKYDNARSKYLEELGLTVLRFTNLDVLENIEGVMDTIDKNSLNPSLQKRETGKRRNRQ
jgi:very-short-patch-repair endonuclease